MVKKEVLLGNQIVIAVAIAVRVMEKELAKRSHPQK